MLGSTDNGLSWNALCNTGTSNYDLEASLNVLYIAAWGGNGPLVSINNGVNCSLVGPSGLGYDTYSIGQNGTYLFAGTDGYGIWKYVPGGGPIGIAEQRNDYLLAICNPFDQVISLNLPSSSENALVLYDVTGKVVYNDQNSSGSVSINTSLLSPGIYMLKIANNDGVQVRKLVKE